MQKTGGAGLREPAPTQLERDLRRKLQDAGIVGRGRRQETRVRSERLRGGAKTVLRGSDVVEVRPVEKVERLKISRREARSL